MNNSTTIEKVKSLTNDGLYALLKNNGKSIGPVVATTRSIYEKRIFSFFKSNRTAENDFIRRYESYESGKISKLPSMRVINNEEDLDESEEEKNQIISSETNKSLSSTKVLTSNKDVDFNNNVKEVNNLQDQIRPKNTYQKFDENNNNTQPKSILIKRNPDNQNQAVDQNEANFSNSPPNYNCIPKNYFSFQKIAPTYNHQPSTTSFFNKVVNIPSDQRSFMTHENTWMPSKENYDNLYPNYDDRCSTSFKPTVNSQHSFVANPRSQSDDRPYDYAHGYKQPVFVDKNRSYSSHLKPVYNYISENDFTRQENTTLYNRQAPASPFNQTLRHDYSVKGDKPLFGISYYKEDLTLIVAIVIFILVISLFFFHFFSL